MKPTYSLETVLKEYTPSYCIDRQLWSKLSIFDQMGNIGSEVGRAIIAKRQDKHDNFKGALCRALDLFDATIEVTIESNYPGRIHEIKVSREQFLNLFFAGTFEEEAESIERYFMQYAVAARRRQFA